MIFLKYGLQKNNTKIYVNVRNWVNLMNILENADTQRGPETMLRLWLRHGEQVRDDYVLCSG